MFATTIAGIPAQIDVTYYVPGEAACISGPADNWHPGHAEEVEFLVFDRRGYKADWLARKITPAIQEALEIECIEYMRELASDY